MRFDHALVNQTIAGLRAMPQRGRYRCIVADFPWWWSGGRKGRPQHYPRMRDKEIYALGPAIRELADPEGCWFLPWGLGTKPRPALNSIDAAGFRFSSRFVVWIKIHRRFARLGGVPIFLPLDAIHKGMGFTSRKNAEDCWLGRIGKPARLSRNVGEILFAPVEEHSRKPQAFYDRVEEYCAGPRADLFARQHRDGWDGFGNETGKFPARAAA